jgi:transcriptional regulator with XRE-family HTH domain
VRVILDREKNNRNKRQPKHLRETFSSNMRDRRKSLGLSQEKLAEIIGVTTQTINDIECCRSWLSDKTLEKLAIALDMDVYRFFTPGTLQEGRDPLSVTAALLQFREDIKVELSAQIKANIDRYFMNLIFPEMPPRN